jgi:hypothetical protein
MSIPNVGMGDTRQDRIRSIEGLKQFQEKSMTNIPHVKQVGNIPSVTDGLLGFQSRTIANNLAAENYENIKTEMCVKRKNNETCKATDVRSRFEHDLTTAISKHVGNRNNIDIGSDIPSCVNNEPTCNSDTNEYIQELMRKVMDDVLTPKPPTKGAPTEGHRYYIDRNNIRNIANEVLLNLKEYTNNTSSDLNKNAAIFIKSLQQNINTINYAPYCSVKVDPRITPKLHKYCSDQWGQKTYSTHDDCIKIGSHLIDDDDLLRSECNVKTVIHPCQEKMETPETSLSRLGSTCFGVKPVFRCTLST